MPRKRWTPQAETPDLLRSREKRKWQIALRRYVLKESPGPAYAPYFALDIANLRKWLELQFIEGMDWDNFGKSWQLDHLVPVAYFDFSIQADLKLCWNFINLRAEPILLAKDKGNRPDLLAARSFFAELFRKTSYQPCQDMLRKIDQLALKELLNANPQLGFIQTNRNYLDQINNYSAFEFQLLNNGKSPADIEKEMNFYKKWEQ